MADALFKYSKELCLKYKNDLESNRLDRIFEAAGLNSSKLADFLALAKIDPLERLDIIPNWYFCNRFFDEDLDLSKYKNLIRSGCNSFDSVIVDGNITLPMTMRVLGEECFQSCQVRKIEIPDSIQSLIPDYCFGSCACETIKLPKIVKNIGKFAFFDSYIHELYFPDKIATISEKAFSDARIMIIYFRGDRYVIPKNGANYFFDTFFYILQKSGIKIVY